MRNLFDDHPETHAFLVEGVAGGGKTTFIAAHADGCVRAGLRTLLITHSRAGRQVMEERLAERGVAARAGLLTIVTIDELAEQIVTAWGDRRFLLKREYVERFILPHILQEACQRLVGRLENCPGTSSRDLKMLMHDIAVFRTSGAYLLDDPDAQEERVRGKLALGEPELARLAFQRYEICREGWRPDLETDWHSSLERRSDAKYQAQLDGFRCFDEAVSDLLAHERYLGWRNRRTRAHNDYQYILVDEFHDTSPLQLEFLSCLFQRATRVLVVGDRFQNIYAWRGSEPDKVFEDFRREFRPMVVPWFHTFRFGQNLATALGTLLKRPDWQSHAAGRTRICTLRDTPQSLLTNCLTDENYSTSVVICKDEATVLALLLSTIDVIAAHGAKVSYPLHRCFAVHIFTYLCALRLPDVEWREDDLRDAVWEFLTLPPCHFTDEERLGVQQEVLPSLKSERGVKKGWVSGANLKLITGWQLKDEPKRLKEFFDRNMRAALNAWMELPPDTLLGTALRTFVQQTDIFAGRTRGGGRASRVMSYSWAGLLDYVESHNARIADWPALLRRLTRLHDTSDALRVLTVEEAKGRQFRKVVVYGLNEGEFPSRDEDWAVERNRFYVASSRAIEELVLHANKAPSAFFRHFEH